MTYLRIPQSARRHAVILSKPAWMWGAEMGVNDQGVVIGNEAVFTKLVDRSNSALLGMDLLRLGLERGSTAREAMDTICMLLEEFGQGGPAGFRDKAFRYDNSYLIADADEAWVLETAGRHWAAKRVDEYTAISNALTIETEFDAHSNGLIEFARQNGYFHSSGDFNFAEAFDTRFMKFMGCAVQRRQLSLQQQATSSAVSMASGLRQHRKDDHSSNRDVCMHASGVTRPSQTCGSMIVQLQPGQPPRIMVTGTSAPCISLFQPIDFTDDPNSVRQLRFQEDDDVRNSL